MSNSSLVSIVIPLYNRRNLINDTLKSLLSQQYTSWEAIILDDGSTDGSLEIVKEFESKDARFKIFQRDRLPKGAPTCRNIGMDLSLGEYVIFLDSDDLFAPYCLQQRVAYMRENPYLDFAVFNVLTFKKKIGDSNILWNVFNEKDDLERFLSADSPWQTSSPIWRRQFLKNVRWDEGCISGQDWEFHIKALSFKPKYTKLDAEPDVFVRRGESDRISKNFYKLPQILNRHQRWQNAFDLLNEKKLWKKEFNKKFASFYFAYAEYPLIKGESVNIFKFYYPVLKNGLLGFGQFLNTFFYLLVLRLLKNHKYLRNWFKRKYDTFIPDYLKRENMFLTQENVKLDWPRLENLLKLNQIYIKS